MYFSLSIKEPDSRKTFHISCFFFNKRFYWNTISKFKFDFVLFFCYLSFWDIPSGWWQATTVTMGIGVAIALIGSLTLLAAASSFLPHILRTPKHTRVLGSLQLLAGEYTHRSRDSKNTILHPLTVEQKHAMRLVHCVVILMFELCKQ